MQLALSDVEVVAVMEALIEALIAPATRSDHEHPQYRAAQVAVLDRLRVVEISSTALRPDD